MDGCSPNCQIEVGFQCNQEPTANHTICVPICGDGMVAGNEECDDDNTVNGDGCSADCLLESSQNNTGNPICGNNIVEVGEKCDDGNMANGDGCTPNCQIETNWT